MDPFAIQSKDEDIRDRKLHNFSADRQMGDYWPSEEILSSRLVSPVKKNQIDILRILVIIGLLVIFSRTFWLQVFEGNSFRGIAEGNRIRVERIRADRGLIYDRQAEALVKNIPHFSLLIIPGDLPREPEVRAEVLDKLFSLLDQLEGSKDQFAVSLSREKLEERLPDWPKVSWRQIVVRENLDYQAAMRLKLKLTELPGIFLELNAQREYLTTDRFSHLIGYVGKIEPEELVQYPDYSITDLIGKTGLELQYEDLLKGQDGQRRIEINAMGSSERIVSQSSAKTGQNLILAIDSGLQKKISDIMIKYIRTSHGQAGAAIAMDPRNGEILSIFSWPSFNNNLFVEGAPSDYQALVDNPGKPFFFRAIAGQYPPGSTIKPVIAAGALEEGIINKKTVIFSQGGIEVGQWFFPDWKQGGHGSTNLIKGLAESVNTFFYYIGGGVGNFKGLGIEKINHYAQLFGLNEKTGIDLPSEKEGFLATPSWKASIKKERWYIGDTYHLAIGQGDILVTPLQVANFTSVIANGGTLFQPRLVKEIINPETGQKKEILPEIIGKNFIKSEHIDLVRQGLRAAVTQGSARRLAALPIKVAGKTGTAQVAGEYPHAWFTCFAPYEKPEIVLTILVENGGEGSQVAVPAAEEILEWWINQRK